MERICKPIVNLYALTGEAISEPLRRGLKGITVSKDLLEKQNKRIEKVFMGERLDYIPTSADIRWWFAEKINDGTLEKCLKECNVEKILTSSFVDLNNTGEPDEMEPLPSIEEEEIWSGEPLKYRNGGFPGSKRTVVVKTPLGNIRAVEKYASRSFGIVEYPVKSIEDLRIVRYIYEQRAKYSTDKSKKLQAPLTPLQTYLIHLAGVEKGVELLFDYNEEVEDFMNSLEEIQLPVIEEISRRGKLVFSVENFSAEISTGYFDRYLKSQLLKRSEIAQKYGAIIGVHHDGKLMPLFGKLKDAGVKYANGITAAPSGDVEPFLLRTLAGQEMIMADIFPQAIFMSYYDENMFVKYIEEVAKFYKNDNRIVFGIGDMLPCVSDIKRFETMLDIIEKVTI